MAEVIDNNTLCFIWQDNKAVSAISTAHSLYRPEDKVQRIPRCPRITSENQRILLPVFDGQPFKKLFIPRAINDYNHHMKGVDQANQLRAGFTCYRKQNYRTWWPLFFWLIDVANTNAYLLWKWSNNKQHHKSHRVFLSTLCNQLLHSNDQEEEKQQEQSQSLPAEVLQRLHKCVREEYRGRCE